MAGPPEGDELTAGETGRLGAHRMAGRSCPHRRGRRAPGSATRAHSSRVRSGGTPGTSAAISVSASVSQPPANAVLGLLGGVGLAEDLGEEELDETPVVTSPGVALYSAQPSSDPVSTSKAAAASRSALSSRQARGNGPTSTSPRDPLRMAGGQDERRAGRRATAPRRPPLGRPPRPSRRARPRRTLLAVRRGIGGPVGAPLPAGRTSGPGECRAKSGICIFQQREWTIDHVGRSRRSALPAP